MGVVYIKNRTCGLYLPNIIYPLYGNILYPIIYSFGFFHYSITIMYRRSHEIKPTDGRTSATGSIINMAEIAELSY